MLAAGLRFGRPRAQPGLLCVRIVNSSRIGAGGGSAPLPAVARGRRLPSVTPAYYQEITNRPRRRPAASRGERDYPASRITGK
jgi:hypothetical protein